MAGRPLRNAMIDALARRVAKQFNDESKTALDYALDWQGSGKTLNFLAQALTRDVNGGDDDDAHAPTVSRFMLTRYLYSLAPNAETLLTQARAEGAHARVESGVDALDESNDDKDAINAADKRLAAAERIAAVWNADYRNAKGAQVQVNIGALHLDALRRVNADRPLMPATATLVLSAGESEAEVEDES